MIFNLFRRTSVDHSMAALYGAIVAQARRPAFYTRFGVPDTTQGRLEMIVLHAAMVVSRLEADAAQGRRLGQQLFDWFCSDMDGNLREMGVGDLAVPRKMKAIGEAFYGRKRAYAEALASSTPEPLIAALQRNLPQGKAADGQRERMVRYMREMHRALAVSEIAAMARGEVAFPDPEAFTRDETV